MRRAPSEVRRFDRADHGAVLPAGRRHRGRARRPRGQGVRDAIGGKRQGDLHRSVDARGQRAVAGANRERWSRPTARSTRPAGQWVYDLMERGRSGRVFALDLASGKARILASGLQPCVRRLCGGRRHLGQRELAASRDRDRSRRQPARGAGQSAGLSVAAVARRRRRLLAHGVHRAHPTGRVRAARKRLSPPHDGGDRSGILDRAQSCDPGNRSSSRCRARS